MRLIMYIFDGGWEIGSSELEVKKCRQVSLSRESRQKAESTLTTLSFATEFRSFKDF